MLSNDRTFSFHKNSCFFCAMSVSFFSYSVSLHFHIRICLIIHFYLVDLVCFSLYLISHWCWVLLFLCLILVVFVIILYSLWYSIFLLCWLVICDLIELLLHEWHINCYDKVVVMKPIYVFELLLEKNSSIYIYSLYRYDFLSMDAGVIASL